MLVRSVKTCAVADPGGGRYLFFTEQIPVDLPLDTARALQTKFPWLLEPAPATLPVLPDDEPGVQQATAAPGEKRKASRTSRSK